MADKNILIVEDERPLAEAIKAQLEKLGFSVVTARTVDQALLHLEEVRIDAVWLDHYLLGKENGLDFIAKIKTEGSKWNSVPVFVVSNTASDEHVQSYMRLGAKNYYVKAEHSLSDIIKEITSYLTSSKD